MRYYLTKKHYSVWSRCEWEEKTKFPAYNCYQRPIIRNLCFLFSIQNCKPTTKAWVIFWAKWFPSIIPSLLQNYRCSKYLIQNFNGKVVPSSIVQLKTLADCFPPLGKDARHRGNEVQNLSQANFILFGNFTLAFKSQWIAKAGVCLTNHSPGFNNSKLGLLR